MVGFEKIFEILLRFVLMFTSVKKAIVYYRGVYIGVGETKSCLIVHCPPGVYLLLSGSIIGFPAFPENLLTFYRLGPVP